LFKARLPPFIAKSSAKHQAVIVPSSSHTSRGARNLTADFQQEDAMRASKQIRSMITGVSTKAHTSCPSWMLASAAALALAGCGGGGGTHVASIPTPPVTPTPTPPPPPAGYQPVQIFPNITTSTTFASVGVELSGNPVRTDGFSVRYDAASNLYIFDFPSNDPGGFYSNSSDSSFWSGGLIATGSGTVWPPMSVLKPSPTNPAIQLSYTSLAGYLAAGPMDNLPYGFVAFGSATPTGSVPVTGSAGYSAYVLGASVDRFYWVDGSATMQFDFGNGTLAGHFDPNLIDFYGNGTRIPLGQYDFINTVFGVGSTTFSGQLSNAAVPGVGTFSGQFTGPSAQELMSSWIAPFHDPATNQDSQITGVWVGKQN
jgi:hypothetical protein